MKTILYLNDETTRPTQLLQNAAPGEIPLRQPEAVAGCDCDRWGHPRPGGVDHHVPPEATISSQLAR